MYSEGEVCSEMDKEEREKVVPLCTCECEVPQEEPTQKINVVRILGEGSQGTVALCHYEDLKKKMTSNDVNKIETQSLRDGVFAVKVFEHIKKNKEV